MNPEKYEVVPIGITKQGYWLSPESRRITRKIEGNILCWQNKTDDHQLLIAKEDGEINILFDKLVLYFHYCMGPFGEDGAIQGFARLITFPMGSELQHLDFLDKINEKIFIYCYQTKWIMVKRRDWKSDSKIKVEMKNLCYHYLLNSKSWL